MAIAFVNAGTEGSGSGASVSPGSPASPQNGDIWLCVVHSSSTSRVISMDAAWTQIVQSASTTGRLAVFWFRYAGSTPTLTVSRGGTGTQGFNAGIASFRGCVASGSPVDVQSTAATGTDASIEFNSLAAPSVDGCMLICADGASDDNARSTLPASFTNAFEDTLTGTQRAYVSSTGAPDTSCAIHYLLQATKAAVSGLVDTMAAADPWVSILFALKPGAAAFSITGAVTITPAVASAMDFTRNASIAGAVTVTPSVASAMDFTRNASIAGAVTITPSIASAMQYAVAGNEIAGAVTVTISVAAEMDYTFNPSIAGAVTVTPAVASAMTYNLKASIVGSATVSASVLAIMIYNLNASIVGAVTVTPSIEATMESGGQKAIAGDITISALVAGGFAHTAVPTEPVPLTATQLKMAALKRWRWTPTEGRPRK